MKNYIIEFLKLNPKYGYFELSKVFGFKIHDLIDILQIRDKVIIYTYSNSELAFYDKETNNIIYEEHSDGYWEKYHYDENDNLIFIKNSEGYWEKYKYNKKRDEIYYKNSLGSYYFGLKYFKHLLLTLFYSRKRDKKKYKEVYDR